MAKVIFLIINWNGEEKIERCLRSIKTHLHRLDYEILVVDNNSADRSCELIQEQFPQVFLLPLQENMGFARGCNQGLAYLRERQFSFDYLVFLNNDVELRDNSLKEIFSWMDERQEVAACLPAVLDREGRAQSGVGGFKLSLGSAFNHFFFLSVIFPRMIKGLFFNQHYFYMKKRLIEVDWLTGAALVIRQPALEAAGPWLEYFFMYAEDLAYGSQLKRTGKLVYYPGAKVYHLQEEDKRRQYQVGWLNSVFAWYLAQARKATKRKGRGSLRSRLLPLELLLLKFIFLAGFALRWIAYAFRASLKPGRGNTVKKKEMAAFAKHIVRTLLKTEKSPNQLFLRESA